LGELALKRWALTNGEKSLVAVAPLPQDAGPIDRLRHRGKTNDREMLRKTINFVYGVDYAKWDYKFHIGKTWGGHIRLGNYHYRNPVPIPAKGERRLSRTCPHDAFSNFHYGYLSAAAGLSEFTTIGLGDVGQKIISGEEEGEARSGRADDDFATKGGYDAYDVNDDEEAIRTKLMSFLKRFVISYGNKTPAPQSPPKSLISDLMVPFRILDNLTLPEEFWND